MPRRNRVTPFGEIVAIPERGTLMGNRGRLHDPDGRIVRPFEVRRWISCRTEFRGRRREVMQPSSYTELFFLDEPTALAAGHRPCAECRNADYRRFRDLWRECGLPGERADPIDAHLHEERLLDRTTQRMHRARAGSLPDGCMVHFDGRPWLVHEGALLGWSPSGYDTRQPLAARGTVDVLTPRPLVAVLATGYLE